MPTTVPHMQTATDNAEESAPTFATDSLKLYDALTAQSEHQPHLRKALSTLDAALRLYGANNLAVAFNGGKDATVVLHLTLAALANYQRVHPSVHTANGAPRPRLTCLYLEGGDTTDNFAQVDAFVRATVDATPAIDCTLVPEGIRDGLQHFVASRAGLCAFVMGTRRGDPHGAHMEHFEPSSPSWPAFMRVNPILEWRYADVWRFLRDFRLPFCSLYERGYTSIGSVSTTRPNPALRCETSDGKVSYKPAWLLEDEALERAGRVKKGS